jgi:hypothetical protein
MFKRLSLVTGLSGLILLPAPAHALYVWRDAQGVRQYADVCPAGVRCREISPRKRRSMYTAPSTSTDTTSTSSETETTASGETGSTSGDTSPSASADTNSTSDSPVPAEESSPAPSGGETTTTLPDPSGAPVIGNVSGAFAHGQSISISGTSFGSKSHAGPMLYDDFDDASATSIGGREPQIHQGNLSHYGKWIRTAVGPGSIPQIVRDAGAPKARSTYHARMAFSGDYWALYLTVDPVNYFTTGREMYISFWYRYRKTGANHPGQTKAWIAYPPSGSDKAYFSTAFDTCQSGGWRLHRSEGFSDVGFGMAGPDVNDEWIRIETYLKQSAPSTANGAWEQVVYRTKTPMRISKSLGNAALRTSSADWTFWGFGGAYYGACANESATIDVDEFYMDSTRARVELCNAATYAASTQCELQLPSAWSDTSITATLKRGQLNVGAAYLYVFNTPGKVNATGYPVNLAP